MTLQSKYPGEPRYIDLAEWGGKLLALVYTMRVGTVRVISLRPANRKERRLSMAKNVREIDWERVRVELADSIQAAKNENITLIHYDPSKGEAWRITPEGQIEPYEIINQTDWARVNAMTEEEIEAVDTSDEGLPDDWIDHAEIVRFPSGKVVNNARWTMECSCLPHKPH